MPVLFFLDPLCCLIKAGGQDADGLTLAVMAAPCHLRQRLPTLSEKTAALLPLLLQGPQSATRETDWRYQRLFEAALVSPHCGRWAITDKGRAYLAARPDLAASGSARRIAAGVVPDGCSDPDAADSEDRARERGPMEPNGSAPTRWSW